MRSLKLILPLILISLISCTDFLIGNEGKLDEEIYLNYTTKTDLELPFKEEYYVFAGGRTHFHGVHHIITHLEGQRYAYDFSIVIDNRSFPEGKDPKKNESHYAFGMDLIAPAGGKVISLENNIDDNYISGIVNSNINDKNIAGNYIMIDHLNGEYSLMAHFKKGSILVNVGDVLVKGQKVGKLGNSGNSTGPHLHYHLQNTPIYLNGLGLPAQFNNYFANGKFVERGEPIKGQQVIKK